MNNQNISNKNGADKKNAAKAVRIVINAMPTGKEFHGWELKNECVKLYPELKNMYIETFLREMRGNCKSCYRLKSRSKSLYVKIGNPILTDHVISEFC